MSVTSDVKPVLTEDARISDIKSQLDVSALLGSRDNSFYSYAATTTSANSVNVNCSLPSENVVFDRLIFIGARVNFKMLITIPVQNPATTPVAGTQIFEYGSRFAFQQFPLNAMISNNNIKVNSVSFNMAQDDLQSVLLRTQDLNDLAKSNMCMSPSYPDQYLEYKNEQMNFSNNPLAGFNLDNFTSLVSRGSHPITVTECKVDNAVVANLAAVVAGDPANAHTYEVSFSADFFEPLLLSPFIFSSKKISKAGLVNVQNLTFNFTIDNALRNVWSQLPYSYAGATSVLTLQQQPFSNFNVYINCLTPHITQTIPPVSILPCYTWERYLSSAVNTGSVPASPAAGSTADIVLNNLVLSQIPEQIIVVVRKQRSAKTYSDANSYFTINGCSINFLNSQGMLSNCNSNLLYKISKENGYADSWYQWSGLASGAVKQADGSYKPETVKTTGSVLIINPAKDLSIGSPYLTNGSRGNYNLQIKLNVTNNYSAGVIPEIMIACKNSCYLKNYPGAKSTLTSGMFDMSSLSAVVTEAGQLSNADLVESQQGGISDQSIGDIDNAPRYQGSGVKRPMHGQGARFGGSMGKEKSLKNKICL
jgi:hypothetical protein